MEPQEPPQEQEAKAATSFLTGAKVVIPAVVSLVFSIVSVVWLVANERTERLLLEQKVDIDVEARITLQGEVKILRETQASQAIVLGIIQEKLTNIDENGKETLRLFRDYTRGRN